MSRVHLGMIRPIKQFVKYYTKLLNLIDEIEMYPPEDELQKQLYISRLKLTFNDDWNGNGELAFNDTLIQLNNVKNTQIELLNRESRE